MTTISPRRADAVERAMSVVVSLMPAAKDDLTWRGTYVEFAETRLGMRLTDTQKAIYRAVEEHPRTAVRSCHGSGKTRGVAGLIAAFLHSHVNSKVITTGPGNTQVNAGLWQDVGLVASAAPGPLIGKPGLTKWTLAPGWYGMGIKPDDTKPGRLTGFHAPNILVVAEEASEVATAILDILESLMTGGGARLLYIGNPVNVGGPYYEAFHANSGLFHTIKIEAKDTPNVQAGRIIVPGLIDQKWIDDQVRLHGAESDWVQSRVYAEFPKGQASAWVQLRWIDQIAEATKVFDPHRLWNKDAHTGDPLDFGVDVARSGEDENWVWCRQGPYSWAWDSWHSDDTTVSTQMVKNFVNTQRETVAAFHGDAVHSFPVRFVNVDETGIGAGVKDNLELDRNEGRFDVRAVVGVNFGASSSDSEKWQNKRQEMWYGLRERSRDLRMVGNLPPVYVADVTGARFLGQTGYLSGRTMEHVEPKEEMKKRLKRSPDAADAAALAYYIDPEALHLAQGATLPVSIVGAPSMYYDGGDDEDE